MITITGSLAYDYLMKFNGTFKEHLIENKKNSLSVSFFAESLSKEFGGTAGNIAYSLGLLEIKPTLIGTLGKDHHDYFNHLTKNELSTKNITIIDNDISASAYILTDLKNNQITSFYGGAMLKADETEIPDTTDFAIIAPTEVNTMRKHAKYCTENNIKYIFDPGQSLPLWDKDALMKYIEKSYILILNEYETSLVIEKLKISKGNLIKMANIFIETLGAQGSCLHYDNNKITIPAIPVEEVIDPTGCGDAYRSGLLYGLSSGFNIKKCCQLGSILSSYPLRHKATQAHYFEFDEIEQKYKVFFKEKM
jgi:adenosine kinase